MSISRGRTIVIAIVALVLIVGVSWNLYTPGRPHIVLITLDTTRADRLGCYGYAPALTPALDALAKRGILFERTYTPVPLTVPAHASLMTGLYPPEHGVRLNGESRLNESVHTLATVLKKEGYQTGAFVAAFVLQRQFGLDQGFDVYDDDLSTAEPIHDQSHQYRAGEFVVDTALRWLQSQDDQPFFCWIHLYDPHDPYLAHPQLFGDEFQDRAYDAEIAYVDRQVKRVLDQLKARGIDEETYVIVVGDHGESLGEHGERTHGYMTYNATMHVPFIVAGPTIAEPPRRIDSAVSLVDFAPTIFELLQIEPPHQMAGRSLVPAFEGRALSPQLYYGESEQAEFAEYGLNIASLDCLIAERWKYIRTMKNELYDRKSDPAELKNLAELQPEQTDEMEAQLTRLNESMIARKATALQLPDHDRRVLESLGYVSGTSPTDAVIPRGKLHDIKEVITAIYQYRDAAEYMEDGQHDRAIELFSKVIVDVPDYFVAHTNLGTCFARTQEYELAAQSFKKALQILPDTKIYIDLAKVHILQEDFPRAIEALTSAIEREPTNAMAHFVLGDAYRFAGEIEKARQEYELVLRLDPGFEQARYALRTLPKK
ncbi:MAG: sulfatase-like hydrolase/transferase [Planctomycetaceae bacterium]